MSIPEQAGGRHPEMTLFIETDDGVLMRLRQTGGSSMDDYAWEMTKVKGWIDITVRWAGNKKALTIYDPSRLAQEVEDATARQSYFAEPAVVVVPVVTREAVETAVAQLAQRGFADVA